MAIEVERLVATLEARMDKYDKALRKARGDTDRTFSKIEQRGNTMEKRLQALGRNAFGGFSRGALAAVAGAVTLTAAIGEVRGALTKFDSIAKQAKAAGLDGEFFQEIAYQAKLGGVEIDQLSQSLNAFNRNAGMAVVGKGELVEKLKQLDPGLLEAIRNAQSQEQRLRLIADAIAKETDASRKAALAAAAFGDAGVKMVEVLKGGSAQIDETIAKAKALGIVVDRDVLAHAEELNDQFTTATEIIDTQLKQAFVNAAPALVTLAQWAAELARLLGVAVDTFNSIENRKNIGPLQASLVDIMNERTSLVAQREMMGAGADPYIDRQIDDLTNKALEIQDRIKQLQIVAQGGDPNVHTPGAAAPAAPLPPVESGSAKRDPYAETIKSLEHEIALIGLDAREQEKLNRIREAGVALGSNEARAIEALVDQKYDLVDANEELIASEERLQEVMDGLVGVATDFATSLVDAFRDGKIEANEMLDILGDVAKKLIDIGGNFLLSALTGGGGFGFRAEGGPVSAGQPYVVGERGPELLIPNRSGTVIPNDALRSASGGGNVVSPSLIVNVDARGAQMGVAEQVQGRLSAWARFEFPRLWRQMQADPARGNL